MAPRRKPNPGPKALPPIRTTMNIAENPAMNPGNRKATIAPARTAMRATVFGPMPPRPSSTNNNIPTADNKTRRTTGASMA
ncbi:MAG: hypothetical protein M3285_09025 [Actinomycetota bacterium]|nr:hypothetical protein [Actinomycetota bacterium]